MLDIYNEGKRYNTVSVLGIDSTRISETPVLPVFASYIQTIADYEALLQEPEGENQDGGGNEDEGENVTGDEGQDPAHHDGSPQVIRMGLK